MRIIVRCGDLSNWWNDSENAKILETKSDIDSFRADDQITVSIARPTNSDHIVNCPFIDPFQ